MGVPPLLFQLVISSNVIRIMSCYSQLSQKENHFRFSSYLTSSHSIYFMSYKSLKLVTQLLDTEYAINVDMVESTGCNFYFTLFLTENCNFAALHWSVIVLHITFKKMDIKNIH